MTLWLQTFVRWRLNFKLDSCHPSGSWIRHALELYVRRKHFDSRSVYRLSLLKTFARRHRHALELYVRRKHFDSRSVYCLSLLKTFARRHRHALELYVRRKHFDSRSVYRLSLLKTFARRQLGWIPTDCFHIFSYSSFETEILVTCNNRISCS